MVEILERIREDRIKTGANRRLAKKRVQCLNEALCFVSSSVLADSLVLRNPLPPSPASLAAGLAFNWSFIDDTESGNYCKFKGNLGTIGAGGAITPLVTYELITPYFVNRRILVTLTRPQ